MLSVALPPSCTQGTAEDDWAIIRAITDADQRVEFDPLLSDEAVAVSRNFWTKYSEDAVRFWGTKADRAGGQFLQSESFSLKFVP